MPDRTVRLAVIAVLALSLMPTSSWAVEVVAGPTLTMDPGGVTPLAGLITLRTDVPSRVTLSVTDGVERWGVDFPGLRTDHSLPLLGLKPADTYTVEVILTDASGARRVLAPGLVATTPALPADFPRLTVYHSEPSRMEPGFTLLDKFRRVGTTGGQYSMVVDHKGDVRWYSTRGGSDGMLQLPNGNLLLLDSSEMDMLGNLIVRRTLQVPGLFLHHEMFPTTYGNFLSLTLEKEIITDYPTSEVDPTAPRQTVQITSDGVVEFRPDGSLANIWHLTQMLDPRRIGYDSTKPGFPLFDSPDWSHSNAVLHDPSDDSIIVSIRHQDAVIKFSRATGKLIWILGPHDNWGPEFQPYLLTPVGTPFEWQFHQHAPMLTPQGTLLLFDNGNYRASPFDGRAPQADLESYSRAVEYAIDESKMEVRQVWEYGAQLDWRMFSASQGDADWMPQTGNVLITLSDTRHIAGASGIDWGFGLAHTAIVEVDHATPARKVFDLRVYDPNPASRMWVYRSERIPSLYPPFVRLVFDSDADGVLDSLDNCTLVANADQRDTDFDGFGNICDPDLNNDGVIEYIDYLYLGSVFGTANPLADLDGDGVVSWPDLQILVDRFLGAPGPSGLRPVVP